MTRVQDSQPRMDSHTLDSHDLERDLPSGGEDARGLLEESQNVRAIKDALPDLHVHAFSALEVWQGAATLGLPLDDYLSQLADAGLGSLPGTAAEILDDEVRRVICPDKVTTSQWLEVHDAAHRVGLRSNVTMMFGHVDVPRSWARHLLGAREQQRRSEPTATRCPRCREPVR